MGKHLAVGLPDEVHAELVRRAAERGISLRACVAEVLTAHAERPAVHEWLSSVRALPRVRADVTGGNLLADRHEDPPAADRHEDPPARRATR